jgi:glycine/D-amino acid oxidase-like deaminating enzyme
MGMYLLEHTRDLGTTFRSGHVDAVRIVGNGVSGITLDAGEKFDCELFVNAAGPYFKKVAALCGIDLPVHTELHLKLAFEDPRDVIDRRAPLLIWNDPVRLPWQEDERAMLSTDPETRWLTEILPGGAHTRPEGAAESSTTLMLWDYKTRSMDPVFPLRLDEQYPEVVLRGLSVMLPGLRAYFGRATRPRVDGGYYVKTPENRLLVGPTPVEGAYLIGAVSGYGIMAACAAGELLAAHVVGSPLPSYADAFCLARYEDPAYVSKLELWDHGEL